ncbi:uncharacterized protein LOC110425998 [Herrania umbratica]|uniref:Uncharacterized protein LOC110425998 n=1 Tax=Herrania umbratica TaxID=108875 RepID=A0A6J1BBY7_9ROSI|nr:uncharacterized protein LOC110425998 [Herrania umbratica]
MAAEPASTNVQFTNFSGEIVKLNSVNIWDGPGMSNVPLVIDGQTMFTQTGSVAGIEYKFKHDYTLVVAWINNGVSNKVYAQILPSGPGTYTVQWAQIKRKLEKSDDKYDTGNQYGYDCDLGIEPTGNAPKMVVTFKKAP